MKRYIPLLFFIALMHATGAGAYEFTGYGAVEGRVFLNPPAYSGQKDNDASIVLQAEFYHEIDPDTSLTVTPFVRLDSGDSERTHFDTRELFLLKVFERFEAAVGARKVFWGVTESQHLVDIINQTDLVENPDGEDKLGQPMLMVSVPADWGTLDLFLMPYFRERSFAGRAGRLRGPLRVDTDRALYESSAEEWHTDFAVSLSRSIEEWDIGLSHFYGTSREPSFIAGMDGAEPVLIPYYEIINQTGLSLQLITGEWLWKFEGIFRSGQGDHFFASTSGLEYTFTGVMGSRMDLGVLLEYLYDDRMEAASTPFEDDLMAGARLAVNDAAGSEALAGVIQDLSEGSRYIFVESSRRFGDNLRVTIEARFQDVDEGERFSMTRDDDFVQVEAAWYF